MTEPTAHPLTWPVGVPRARYHDTALFHRKKDTGRGWAQKTPLTMAEARDQLQKQLDLINAKGVTLSTNVQLNLNGQPRSGQSRVRDPGAVCYFMLRNKPIALPCDKWDRVEDNVVAIAKYIEAMRGQERWGVGSIEQAFAGFAQLPAPEAKRHWTSILGLPEDASLDDIKSRYRRLAGEAGAHDEKRLLELNLARDEAVASRSL